jgi:hypothetical protein
VMGLVGATLQVAIRQGLWDAEARDIDHLLEVQPVVGLRNDCQEASDE